eukprot:CAMPEP_0177633826 /NCGR_PEP_ID=MMETSP0447-20121125/3046_1 /TAXON_ID=0 /ORGANISM="Stygamoeba regulata, Strain BSH-02190019" /LENGTH=237 /DNA_ID=CAMNT_0019135515 /DNA_START=97 /DNA_END=807 /DNA_ORIENTATION=+
MLLQQAASRGAACAQRMCRGSGGATRHIATKPTAPPLTNWLHVTLMATMPVTCFGLGFWQYKRMIEKEAIIKKREEQLKSEPNSAMSVEALLRNPVEMDKHLYQRFILRGTFTPETAMYVGPRVVSGSPAFLMICPMRLSSGQRVLVNRGWVPQKGFIPAQSEVEVEVEAPVLFRNAEKPSSFVPANEPAAGRWFSVKVDEMAAHSASLPYLFDSIKDGPGGVPAAPNTTLMPPNHH